MASDKGKGKATHADDFQASLVLAKWASSFFVGGTEAVARRFRERLAHDPAFERLPKESGNSGYYGELCNGLLAREDWLGRFAEYDRNVVRHWRDVTERRTHEEGMELCMKYFQYLALLLTEVYLDMAFNHPRQLIAEVNEIIGEWNAANPKARIEMIHDKDGSGDELRKVAFWMATGAGKTLIMHVNVHQYLEYARAAGRSPKRVIVLTPTEGLSRQHVKELRASGFSAETLHGDTLFGAGVVTGEGTVNVGVIDSGKLISEGSTKKAGEKSIHASEFEGENLVLVDEGHHGSSAVDGVHRRVRDQLCRDGFSFEYSATFGQAVATGKAAAELRALYAKSILYDYSYRYFHEDGYGKEAFILNMPDDGHEEQVFAYLCANLLAFHQQRALFAANRAKMEEFGIASPLCVFVGHTVNGTTGLAQETSDVARIIRFFAAVLSRREKVEELFQAFVENRTVLEQSGGRNPLKDRFSSPVLADRSGREIYDEMLKSVFNADNVETLKVQYEKGTGEITLSVADGRPFGLLNIGDAAGFMKTVSSEPNVTLLVKEIGGASRFETIDDPESGITVLVGSRKFTEGWSSWRVSAMGLLNMGVNEGAQVIQFFGRGVRLKGRGFSLKRSTAEERNAHAPGAGIQFLETLQVFGVRANYMAKFREYLERDGVKTDDSVLTVTFKTFNRLTDGAKKLRVMRVSPDYAFDREKGFRSQSITLFDIPDSMKGHAKKIRVEYNDIATVEFMATDRKATADGGLNEVKLPKSALRLLDWDKIYRRLLIEKSRSRYWNMAISKVRLQKFVLEEEDDWYRLVARREDVAFTDFDHLKNVSRLITHLLCAYMARFYETARAVYEGVHSEMATVPAEWIPDSYTVEVSDRDGDGAREKWKPRLEKLRDIMAAGDLSDEDARSMTAKWQADGFSVIAFRSHLFAPLVYIDRKKKLSVTIRPNSLDAESEWAFVEDLERFFSVPSNAETVKGFDLYLLRNGATSARGIGFPQAGGFYPDFLLWLVDRETHRQHLTFVDPKGMRNVSFNSPKVTFAGDEVKRLQDELNKGRGKDDPEMRLASVILSETPSSELTKISTRTKKEWEGRHVFFIREGVGDDHADYIRQLLAVARAS